MKKLSKNVKQEHPPTQKKQKTHDNNENKNKNRNKIVVMIIKTKILTNKQIVKNHSDKIVDQIE